MNMDHTHTYTHIYDCFTLVLRLKSTLMNRDAFIYSACSLSLASPTHALFFCSFKTCISYSMLVHLAATQTLITHSVANVYTFSYKHKEPTLSGILTVSGILISRRKT